MTGFYGVEQMRVYADDSMLPLMVAMLSPSPAVQEIQGVDSDGNPYTRYQWTFTCGPLPADLYGNPYVLTRLPVYVRRRGRKRPERMSKKWRRI